MRNQMTRTQKYYLKHRKRLLLQKKKYYKENKILILKEHHRWYKRNKIKVAKQKHQYHLKHKSIILKQKKNYRKKYRERIKKVLHLYYKVNRQLLIKNQVARDRKRIKIDIQFKITKNLRRRLNLAIHNNQKRGSAIRDLGCSIEFFKKHLESKFYGGMTWNNYGKLWVIDHKKALFKFDLTDRKQFLKAVNYNNLQPLTTEDHKIKTNKEKFEIQKYALKRIK